MSTIDQLKAAYAAATPGEWAGNNDGIVGKLQEDGDNFVICDCVDTPALGAWPEEIQNAVFIALAHNLMPDLLEAVESLEEFVADCDAAHPHGEGVADCIGEDWPDLAMTYKGAKFVLAKLKGTQS
jgi:hypothetical protein